MNTHRKPVYRGFPGKQGHQALRLFTLLIFCSLLVVACAEEEKKQFVRYTGPMEEVNDVVVRYSEGGRVTVEMKTPKQLRYENENKVFPDSVNITFFDALGGAITTVRADSGRFDNSKNLYTVLGNVIVVNRIKQEYLYTSELNWSPGTQKVYNDKSNRLLNKQKGTVINGTGLDARQDFTEIRLRQISGIFSM